MVAGQKRIGWAVVLAATVTFGAGHWYAGARWRGAALTVLEIGAYVLFARGGGLDPLYTVVPAVVLADAVGSALEIAMQRKGELERVITETAAGGERVGSAGDDHPRVGADEERDDDDADGDFAGV